MTNVIHINEQAFEKHVLNHKGIVLVDFWAPWCGPCRQIAPVLEELAKDYEGQVRVVKVDVQEHPEVAAKFGIRSIPTLKTFKAGQEVGTQVGAANKQQLASLIDQAL